MDRSHAQAIYEIRIGSRLDDGWEGWFEGFQMISGGDVTVLRGAVADQSALHGVLARLRDLSLPLIEVRQVPPRTSDGPEHVGMSTKEEE